MSPSRMGGPAGAADATMSLRQSIGAGLGLKEGFMRERVAQLEADLKMAQQREGLLEAEAMQVWHTGTERIEQHLCCSKLIHFLRAR